MNFAGGLATGIAVSRASGGVPTELLIVTVILVIGVIFITYIKS